MGRVTTACAAIGLAILPGWALAQEGADIVILGETHDNPAHHARQAEIIAEIGPSAVVYEMLTPEQAAAADGIDRADMEALETAFGWDESGWPAFEMYHPVFAAAPDAVIYGAAMPREQVRQAITDGAAAVFGDGATEWGLGPLTADDISAQGQEMQEAHCNALPEEMLPGMVEAQRLRDAHFARIAAAALDETGGPVVIITGNGHARMDRAVPFMLAQGRPDLTVWTLGQFESDPAPEDAALFNAVNVTAPTERDDPCAGF